MKTNLSSLLVGLVMLNGVGIAQAADVAQTNTQSKAAPAPIVVADAQTPKTGVSQAQGRVVLADDQMKGVTAGHFWRQSYLHKGWYRTDCCGFSWSYGWHW
jgi:hypothetical protein